MFGGLSDTARGSHGSGAASPARSAFNRWVSELEAKKQILPGIWGLFNNIED